MAVVFPDTTPRNMEKQSEMDPESLNGSGMYVNATRAPYSHHFQMYDYINHELSMIIENLFNVDISN